MRIGGAYPHAFMSEKIFRQTKGIFGDFQQKRFNQVRSFKNSSRFGYIGAMDPKILSSTRVSRLFFQGIEPLRILTSFISKPCLGLVKAFQFVSQYISFIGNPEKLTGKNSCTLSRKQLWVS